MLKVKNSPALNMGVNITSFGLNLAPFAMQRFLKAILEFVRKHTPYCWGHLDDMIVAFQTDQEAYAFLDVFLPKLDRAGWILNL